MSTFEVLARRLEVEDHPNAERLDVVKVDGFNCISQKGVYQTGDIAIYVPENAVVPEEILKVAGFWDEEKGKGMLAGSLGNRVKPVKLRGIISEGILLNLPRLIESGVLGDWPYETQVVEDWADKLGIKKYEVAIPAQLAGKVHRPPNGPQVKYDIENYKKHRNELVTGEQVIATEKIHGTCTIVCYEIAYPSGTTLVTSKGQAARGLWLKHDPDNAYWKAETKYRIGSRLEHLSARLPEAITRIFLFGETFGIQKGYHYGANSEDVDYRAFDIALEDEYGTLEYVPYLTFESWMAELGIPTVPAIYRGQFDPDIIWSLTEGRETISGQSEHIREGLVVRPVENRYSKIGHVKLKFVSDAYLGKTTGDEFE